MPTALEPNQVKDFSSTYFKDLKPAVSRIAGLPVSSLTDTQVKGALVELQRAVCQLAVSAGLDPKELTQRVHEGRNW